MITMTEIARLTNVSQPTVSRVLNGNQNVNPEIRAKVLACAKEHDYQPNVMARGIKGSRTHLLGVLVTDIANNYFAELAKYIEDEAKRSGYSIILLNSNYDVQQESEYIDVVRRYCVDGLLAVPIAENNKTWQKSIKKLDIPVVIITWKSQEYDSFYVDHSEAGAQMACHMEKRGYERFLFVGKNYDEKYIGYSKYLNNIGKGDKVDCLSYANHDFNDLKQSLEKYVAEFSGERIGIFTYNDMCAVDVAHVLRDMGVKVPEEAGLAGFDDIFFSQHMFPSLTTIRQPIKEIAVSAVNHIIHKIENPADSDVHSSKCFLGKLIQRDSTL